MPCSNKVNINVNKHSVHTVATTLCPHSNHNNCVHTAATTTVSTQQPQQLLHPLANTELDVKSWLELTEHYADSITA